MFIFKILACLAVVAIIWRTLKNVKIGIIGIRESGDSPIKKYYKQLIINSILLAIGVIAILLWLIIKVL